MAYPALGPVPVLVMPAFPQFLPVFSLSEMKWREEPVGTASRRSHVDG